MAEFNESTRRGQFSPSERASWLRASDDLADMAAFWGGDDKVLVAPRGVNRAWLADVSDQMACRIQAIEPNNVSGRLLQDLLGDPIALKQLAALLPEGATVEAWGVTAAVLELVAALRALGTRAEIDAPARGNLWSVGYLDSKLALSDIAGWIPELRVPRSYTALTFDHLLGLVAAMCGERAPFVVKSNVGVGGFGTFLAPAPSGYSTVLRDLGAAMDGEPVFREGPFLVQEYVESAPTTLRPTYDGVVNDMGEVEDVGTGGMLIDGAEYRGVVVGEVELPHSALEEARRVGRAVGRAASALGFRGWFDVDFVLSDEGELFATEINARRTSPVHAFAALSRWREDDPRIRCVFADDHVPVSTAGLDWNDVVPAFDSTRRLGVRCAATIVRSLAAEHPAVGLMVGAASYEEARAGRDELAERLGGRLATSVNTR